MSTEVEAHLGPFADAIRRLDAIPGINQRAAETVIAELGVDMAVFPTARHLASWAGLCPGNNESAGKHRAGTTRKGNRWVRTMLVEVALAATRKKDGPFGTRYRRLLRHRGHAKAVVAVAHALLRTIYHVLASGQEYRNLGPDYFERRDVDRAKARAVHALERLGFKVTVEAVA